MDIQQIYQVVKTSKMRCYFSPTLFSSETETTAETISRTRSIIDEILKYKNPNFKVTDRIVGDSHLRRCQAFNFSLV
ncbi:chlorohydrolase [Streptococcus pneumoniae]|nr:chlorohydrolase [Streptococcus pneumoniae]